MRWAADAAVRLRLRLADPVRQEAKRRLLLQVLARPRPIWDPADHPELDAEGGSAGWVRKLRHEPELPFGGSGQVVSGLSQSCAGTEREVERTAVDSSSIAEIGYDSTAQALEVLFHNGRIYQFLDVPPSVHGAFMASDSKGRFFNEEVRDLYEYVRLA